MTKTKGTVKQEKIHMQNKEKRQSAVPSFRISIETQLLQKSGIVLLPKCSTFFHFDIDIKVACLYIIYSVNYGNRYITANKNNI